jgi:hypothetical protein
MRYLHTRLESQDAGAPPIDVYAFVDTDNRILEGIPAFGRWGRPNGQYCYFELDDGVADFGPDWDDQLYDFELSHVEVREGRVLTFRAKPLGDTKTYKITQVSEIRA